MDGDRFDNRDDHNVECVLLNIPDGHTHEDMHIDEEEGMVWWGSRVVDKNDNGEGHYSCLHTLPYHDILSTNA